MARKKKKDPTDSKEDETDQQESNEFSIDSAIQETIKTQSTLQGLLKGVSEGKGLYQRKKDDEEGIVPQLSYERKKEIAQQYLTAEDLIVAKLDRKGSVKKRPSFVDRALGPKPDAGQDEKYEELQEKIQEKQKAAAPKKKDVKPLVPQAPDKNVYEKLASFFKDHINSYTDRYKSWENSISSLLSILRKMRKITKKNTEDLEVSIQNLFEKAEVGLNQFKVKRNEIERVAGVNIEGMSSEFRRVLGLLELQIKEYQLKRASDDLVRIQKLYS